MPSPAWHRVFSGCMPRYEWHCILIKQIKSWALVGPCALCVCASAWQAHGWLPGESCMLVGVCDAMAHPTHVVWGSSVHVVLGTSWLEYKHGAIITS